MRQAIRIQPYLSRELVDKVRAYAAARSETVSGVVATALGEYLGRDEPANDRVARRLDRVSQSVEQLGRDLNALSVGFSQARSGLALGSPSADRWHGRSAGRGSIPDLPIQGRGTDSSRRHVYRPDISDSKAAGYTADADIGR
jgi:hypothetical protein